MSNSIVANNTSQALVEREMLHAEVMAVGDELTSGERLDTNSQWLSQQLGRVGVSVSHHTTVGDDLAALTAAVDIALRRASLVIITGGLGPTADDLTRDAVAAATSRPLELRPEVLATIQARFGRRGNTMPPQNRVQAMFPIGSSIIENPHGTAPGIDLEWSQGDRVSRLFALPGVPAEMIEMWEASVRPAIVNLVGASRVICHRRIKCFGTGESHLESMLPDLIRRDREPRVGITVHRATITLRVSAAGPDEPTCHQLMEPTLNTIRACLGGLVFGEEDDELEHAVVRLLQQRQQTLAVCEWGTRGLVARWLGAVDTTDRLHAALVVAGIASLEKLLGVSPPDGDRDRFVRAVAERLRDRCQTDLAIVTGPVPDPADDRPQMTLALAAPGQSFAVRRAYRGHPDVVLERAAKQALDLLRHYLTSGTCA